MTVILGLGTNCGDRLEHLRRAIRELESTPALRIEETSPLYESDAMLPDGAPPSWNLPFLNLALKIQTPLSAHELLDWAKKVEKKLGRVQRERWAPREIDIDILAMGDLCLDSTRLSVPHKDLCERPFALLPLADLAPHWANPSAGPHFGHTALELASRWRHRSPDQIPQRTRRSAHSLCELVGIVNITPDSFSDGGDCIDPDRAIEQALRLVRDGATVIDLGAESTRPDATPVNPETEWARLSPVFEGLRGTTGFKISVDTRNARTAERALEQGAHWINDVSGGADPRMFATLAASRADYVIMHSLSVPPRRDETLPAGADPLLSLLSWIQVRLRELESTGVDRSRVILDPGIGFGKTPEQCAWILGRTRAFNQLGVRTLIGHSRKSFFRGLLDPTEDRDLETAILSQQLAQHGVNYLRIHNVKLNAQAIRASLLLR